MITTNSATASPETYQVVVHRMTHCTPCISIRVLVSEEVQLDSLKEMWSVSKILDDFISMLPGVLGSYSPDNSNLETIFVNYARRKQ